MKKKLLKIFALILQSVCFAIPNTVRYFPDTSGEFIFYRDKSFTGEALVGFLYYDDSTYAARFYSPADEKNDGRDITIYVSVNPDSAAMELTGEKITGIKNQDDSFFVNYLHDLLYEFSARRQNVELSSAEKISVVQDFAQFGGEVEILFNPFLSVFNLESIKSADAKILFQAETFGTLSSSADESFLSYRGFGGNPKDKKRAFKKPKAKSKIVSYNSQKISLDESWEKSLDNLWLLGDAAVISLAEFSWDGIFPDAETARNYFVKKFSQGAEKNYPVFAQNKISRTKNSVQIQNVFLQTETDDVTRDFKILAETGDKKFAILTMTVFDGAYQNARNYFLKILSSYSAE